MAELVGISPRFPAPILASIRAVNDMTAVLGDLRALRSNDTSMQSHVDEITDFIVRRMNEMVMQGLAAEIPTAGTGGRLYFATDTSALYYDVGTAWVLIACGPPPAAGYLPRDGSLDMLAPMPMEELLTASLPPAASWRGGIVYVTDAPAGQEFQVSNGVIWLPVVTIAGGAGGLVDVNLAQVAGVNTAVGSGVATASTQRVILATDQPVVPVSDNGGSLTVDGTIAISAGTAVIGHVITDSGSTTVVTGDVTVIQGTGTNLHTVLDSGTLGTITNVVHVDDNAGSLTVDAPVGTPVFVRLSDGSAAIPTLPVSNTVLSVVGGGVEATAQRVTLASDSTGQVKLAAGSSVIGHVIADTGSTTAVTGNVTVVQPTGTSLHAVVDSGTITTVSTVTTLSTITNVVHVDDNAGSLTVDAPVGTPVFVRLSDGAAAITTLPVSLISVPTHSVTIASGGVASGAIASGAVASGAFASGAIASGAVASGAIASGAVASGAFASGSIVAGAVAAGASSFVKLEDAASADADAGVPAMARRTATPANTSGTDLDYEMLQMSAGRLWTSATIDAALPAGSNVIGHVIADTGSTTAVTQATGTNLHAVIDSGTVTTITNTVPTQSARAATATLTNVSSSASSVTLIASNANRLGGSIYNDSNSVLYLKFGSSASSTSFNVLLASNLSGIGGYFEIPNGYTGIVTGIWTTATGSARVMELTL